MVSTWGVGWSESSTVGPGAAHLCVGGLDGSRGSAGRIKPRREVTRPAVAAGRVGNALRRASFRSRQGARLGHARPVLAEELVQDSPDELLEEIGVQLRLVGQLRRRAVIPTRTVLAVVFPTVVAVAVVAAVVPVPVVQAAVVVAPVVPGVVAVVPSAVVVPVVVTVVVMAVPAVVAPVVPGVVAVVPTVVVVSVVPVADAVVATVVVVPVPPVVTAIVAPVVP